MYDFQNTPDNSIEPPPEPLPVRWGLDDLWSAVPVIRPAPSDAERLQSYMRPPTNDRGTASFIDYQRTLNHNQDRASVTYVNPVDYDGTFVPSTSIRTVTPPDANEQLEEIKEDAGWTPPWGVIKKI